MRITVPFLTRAFLAITLPATLVMGADTAPSGTAASPKIDKEAIVQYLRYANGMGPTVSVTVNDPTPSAFAGFLEMRVRLEADRNSAIRTYYLTQDGKNLAAAPIFDLTKSPFATNLQRLSKGSSPAFGPENAPISVYVYSDFQCPYCREEAKALRHGLNKQHQSQVRIIFKPFPLTAMHTWALTAATSGVCIAKQNIEAFWSFHDWVFEHQAELSATNITDRVQGFGETHSLDKHQLATCLHDGSAAAEVNETIEQGRDLGVVQTPTLFVNGRMISGALAADQLNQVIEFELNHQSTEHASEEMRPPLQAP